jgi:hypothetical protein
MCSCYSSCISNGIIYYYKYKEMGCIAVACLGGGLGGLTPLKFRSFDKAEPNFQFCGKYIHNKLIRIRVSLICKLSRTPN